jgi:hypothetical protein
MSVRIAHLISPLRLGREGGPLSAKRGAILDVSRLAENQNSPEPFATLHHL